MVINIIAMGPISRLQGWHNSRSDLKHAALEGEERCGRPTRLYNNRQLEEKRRRHYRGYDRLVREVRRHTVKEEDGRGIRRAGKDAQYCVRFP